MKILVTLRNAVTGWVAIVRGAPDWRQYFALSVPGLVTALALFLFLGLLVISLITLDTGLPGLVELANGVFGQSLSILALIIGIVLTRRVVPSPAPTIDLLVPGLYALIAYLVAGTVLSVFGGPLLILLWVGLAALLFCLGWRIGGWNRGVAAAFAVLTMVLLVGMPVTLYMLLGPPAAPTP